VIRGQCVASRIVVKRVVLTGTFLPGDDETIGRMAWIAPDLAGEVLTTTINDYEVRLWFPELSSDAVSQPGYNGRRGDRDKPPLGVSPNYFTAEMDWSLDDSEADAERASWTEAWDVLRTGANRLTNALRFAHPPTGLAGNGPQAKRMTARDADGQELKPGVPLNPSQPMIVGLPVADRAIVERGLAGAIDVPEILLAQAAYWIRSVPDPKLGLGVVLLAMACETKARRTLANAAPADTEPLLTVLFERGYIFQQSAHELYGHVAKAVLGRSLREDNSRLFGQVGKLFELRNKMAHRGQEPEGKAAWEMVLTTYGAFEWLQQFAAVDIDPDNA
jgi:hypothetical protein